MLILDNCPYNCKDGKVYNRVSHRFEICPHCSELRVKQVRGEVECEGGLTVSELLRVPERYTGLSFNMDLVIPNRYQQMRLIPESVEEVGTVLNQLISDATMGEVPKRTYLFNLGDCADISAFVYPYMMRAYKAGLKVAPLVYSLELQRLRNKLERSFEDEEFRPSVLDKYGDNYDDYLDADICITVLDTGATIKDLNAIRGIIDNRAERGKATMVFTYAYFDRIFSLCSNGDEMSLRLATLVQVRFRKASTGQSSETRQYQSSSSGAPVLSFAKDIAKRSLDTNIGVAQEEF